MCYGLMRDRYEPPTQPGGPGGPWEPMRPQPPARRRADPYDDFAARIDEAAGETRAAGLRRLSKLTWRAIQLSALATVGFVTLFARSAPAQTVTSQVRPAPSVKAATASPSPSPTRKKKNHHPKPRSPSVSSTPGTAPPAAPAPSPTLAPPATAPAAPPPAPTPAPVQTTSSGSHGG